MLHRRPRAVHALAGLLFACAADPEKAQELPGNTGGSTSSDSLSGNGAHAGSSASGIPVGGTTTTTAGVDSTAAASGRGGGPLTTSGGAQASGGQTSSSNVQATGASSGGSSGVSGTPTKGGSNSSGGSRSTASEPIGGNAGATSFGSKRGIAANVAPGAAFYPAVRWWYNWAIRSTGTDVGIEFVPMIWDEATVSAAIPNGAKYLLGFNEPNFFAQANLSPTQAASYWPALEANASSAGVKVVGPGMNYCGPAAECHGTDPYQYLKDFFSACSDCHIDYVAVHWYNCDLPSLRDYLEPGGNLPGFEQFGKPIWITEFSCDPSASVAQQEAYMRAAIPYLEGNPKVARYSWFSAGPIPNAKLINSDGSPTALGRVYISLPHGS